MRAYGGFLPTVNRICPILVTEFVLTAVGIPSAVSASASALAAGPNTSSSEGSYATLAFMPITDALTVSPVRDWTIAPPPGPPQFFMSHFASPSDCTIRSSKYRGSASCATPASYGVLGKADAAATTLPICSPVSFLHAYLASATAARSLASDALSSAFLARSSAADTLSSDSCFSRRVCTIAARMQMYSIVKPPPIRTFAASLAAISYPGSPGVVNQSTTKASTTMPPSIIKVAPADQRSSPSRASWGAMLLLIGALDERLVRRRRSQFVASAIISVVALTLTAWLRP